MSKPAPFLVLQARAEARGLLYGAHMMTYEEAVTPLLRYAHKAGIVRKIGADATLLFISKHFPPDDENEKE